MRQGSLNALNASTAGESTANNKIYILVVTTLGWVYKVKLELKLEDMCECNKTLPLRNKLREINELYSVYSKLRSNLIPFAGYRESITEIMQEILDDFGVYGRIVRNQLSHEVMLEKYGEKVCCADCKKEIAFPDENIESELYSELHPEKIDKNSLN